MIKKVAPYDPVTGEIIAWYSGPESQINLQSFVVNSEPYIEGNGEPGKEYYVDISVPEIIPRPQMTLVTDKSSIAADGVDAATISSIPEGAVVEGVTIGADGELIFTTTDPAEHKLVFSLFPYLDAEVTINAS